MTRQSPALIVVAALTLGACGPGSPPNGLGHGVSACLVTTAQGLNDHGFNHLAAQGVQSAGATLHIKQSRSAADYLSNLENCAGSQPDLTVGISSQMANAVWHVAREHPNLRFALVDSEPIDDNGQVLGLGNVAALLFKAQEAGYMVGALAGLMENQKIGAASHNVVGVLGTNHTPATDAYIAGYVVGARSVDPTISFQLTYSDSEDPAVCKQIGIGQIAKGADVLFEVTGRCAAGYIDAAYDAAAYAIGSDSDLAYLSPSVITSALKKVDRVVALAVSDVQNGHFTTGRRVYTLADDAVGFSTPSSVVPQDVINQVLDIKARIVSGAITPPDTVPPGL